MVVDVKGDRLSVTLHDAALADTLRVIAARTGFRVVVNTSVDDRLSVAFGDLPLDQGLRRLLGGLNALFVYSPTGALEEVRLYHHAVDHELPDAVQQGLAFLGGALAGRLVEQVVDVGSGYPPYA